MSHRFIPSALICFILALLAGCGESGPARYGVSGKVTLAGQPIKAGVITFILEGELSAAGGASITEGAYSIPASTGLPEGSYRVAVSVPDSGPQVQEEMPGISVQPKETIPAKYNSDTELRAKVERGKPNTFDFDLK